MILPRARLGQRRGEMEQVRRGDRADLAAHLLAQLRLQRVARLDAGVERHISVDAGALDVVRIADHRRLGDERVGDERALHLGGAEPVAGDVEHVVDPAGDPVIAVARRGGSRRR